MQLFVNFLGSSAAALLCAAPVDMNVAVDTEARLRLVSPGAPLGVAASGHNDTVADIEHESELLLTVSPQIEISRSRGMTHLQLEYSLDVAKRMSTRRLNESRAALVMHGLGLSARHGRAARTLWSAEGLVDYGAEDATTGVWTFNRDGRPLDATAQAAELRYFRASGSVGVEGEVARRLQLGFSLSGETLLPRSAADELARDGSARVGAQEALRGDALQRHKRVAADVFVRRVRPNIRLMVRPSLDAYEGVAPFWGITTMLQGRIEMGSRSRWTLQAGYFSVWRTTSEGPTGEAGHMPVARAMFDTVLWRRSDSHLDFDAGLGVSPYFDPLTATLQSQADAQMGLLWQLTRNAGVTLDGHYFCAVARYGGNDEARRDTREDDCLLTGRLSARYVLSSDFTVDAGLEGITGWPGNRIPAVWRPAWPSTVYGVVLLRGTTEVL